MIIYVHWISNLSTRFHFQASNGLKSYLVQSS